MIGLDTNVLVRYLMLDDEIQTPQAKAIMDGFTEENPGFISLPTLLELLWVLKRRYKIPKEKSLHVVAALLASPVLCFQENNAVNEALEIARRENNDLPDVLVSIFGRDAGCSRTLTFDQKAAIIPGMVLV